MRRGSVAALRLRHLDAEWGLRGTPLFWSTWGKHTAIRPAQLKRAVGFYEEQATRILGERGDERRAERGGERRSAREEKHDGTRTALSVANGRRENR